MAKNVRWLIGSMVLSLMLISSGVMIAYAQDCDGTTGNDVINCTTNPVNPENQIDGDLGDDNITQAAGVTTSYIDADGQSGVADGPGAGPGGNDTIVNNGTVTISISADFVTGKPGNDSVTNNGTTGDILGDETYDTTAQNGDDVIVNNGIVTGTIRGDGNASLALEGGSGGNDIITNNGTTGNIIGDSGATGVGGNDTITNNGAVTGNIISDNSTTLGNPATGNGGNDSITNNGSVGGYIDAGEGNDTVTIGNNGTVGGTINGGTGTDTLQFQFNDPNEGAAAAATLAGMSPAGGTVTFGGRTYTWTNFEQLKALFTAAAVAGQPITISVNAGQIKDGRLNSYDLGAPFAVYCVPNEFVRVIDIQQNGNNILAFEAKFTAIDEAVASAKANAKSVGIASGQGDFLSADANGSLVASGPTLDGTKTYTFHFQTDCTYIAVGTES